MHITYMQRRLAHQRLSALRTILTATALLVLPTLVRAVLGPWLDDRLWFPTYYPAVLAAGLFLPLWGGVFVWLLSCPVAFYFFGPPSAEMQRLEFWAVAFFLYYSCSGLVLFAATALRTALLRLQAAHERVHTLNLELRHRIKNIMAVVQGLASQTARHAPDITVFQENLGGRLSAYEVALDLIAENDWRLCGLPRLPQTVLAPFANSGQIAFDGPACTISADAAYGFALALHELATNATKYGALSAPGGSVHLSWQEVPLPRGKRCEVVWEEQGGPPVRPPVRIGLGTRLIRPQRGMPAADLAFPETGVVCRFTLEAADPLSQQPDLAPSLDRLAGELGAVVQPPLSPI